MEDDNGLRDFSDEPGVMEDDKGFMSFSAALDMLKCGYRVARTGWNGKGMWICLMHPVRARHQGLWVQKCIGMKTASPRGEIQPGWLASQADLLAEDWMVVPD